MDNFTLRLREYLAFGKEVFLGIGEFWITIAFWAGVGRMGRVGVPQNEDVNKRRWKNGKGKRRTL
jgi:hypothetical protein